MWIDALAQTGGAAQEAGNPTIGMLVNVLPLLAILVIFYFLLIRPQQQQQKKVEQMLKELKKGDRVLTNGGVFGTVIGLDGDKAVLKIAENTKVEFVKSSIVKVVAE